MCNIPVFILSALAAEHIGNMQFLIITLTLYMLIVLAETYNVTMYLQFLSFLHTDMAQVAETLPHAREGST